MLGDTVVSWYAHTQTIFALSTAEAEYVALTDVAKEIVWFKLLLEELGYPQGDVIIREDNQAALLRIRRTINGRNISRSATTSFGTSF